MKKTTFICLTSILPAFSYAQHLDWVYQWGNTDNTIARTAIDAQGNLYTAGRFEGTVDFDPGTAVVEMTSNANVCDAFICKFDINGELVWARMISATSYSNVDDLKVDSQGNPTILGRFDGTVDLDPGQGTLTATAPNSFGFVCKLSQSGDLITAFSMGHTANTSSLELDDSDNMFITGTFTGTKDFDPGSGVSTLQGNSYDQIFLLKLTSTGQFVAAYQFGGYDDENPGDIAFDDDQNIFLTGEFRNTADFDPGPGQVNLTSIDPYGDGFVLKLSPSFEFMWAKQITGSSYSKNPAPISVDHSGNLYVAGRFADTLVFPYGTTPDTLISNGSFDVMISRFDADGTLAWAGSYGGTSLEIPWDMEIDTDNNILITGSFSGTVDLDPGLGEVNQTASHPSQAYVNKVDANGNYVSTMHFEGSGDGRNLEIDSAQTIWFSGRFDGTFDFDPTAGTRYLTTANTSYFVLRLPESNAALAEGIDHSYHLQLFPNPVSSTLLVDLKKTSNITIHNNQGQLVQAQLLSPNEYLNVENLAPGMYWISVENAKGKFIKE